MADPRSLDLTVDPDERTPVTCDLGDPQVVNMSPVGLARFCTLRSRLSQWSYEDACRASHTRRIFGAIGHPDKEIYEIAGVNRYYAVADQRDKLRDDVSIDTDWLVRHDFAVAP